MKYSGGLFVGGVSVFCRLLGRRGWKVRLFWGDTKYKDFWVIVRSMVGFR